MASPLPLPGKLEIFDRNWSPSWNWSPRYMMLTSYWPDPAFFIAYGSDGKSTFAVRGSWAYDFKPFLDVMTGMGVKAVRFTHYPTSDQVEIVPPTFPTKAAFLPKGTDANVFDGGESGSGVPVSASLCVTIPHWNAVVRSFLKLTEVNGASAHAPSPLQPDSSHT
jgi:hypothetical protein